LGEELDCHLVRSMLALLIDWIERAGGRPREDGGTYFIATQTSETTKYSRTACMVCSQDSMIP
jgi:hypothetical protein